MNPTNMLERPSQELKRRAHVVRIFLNAERGLRPVRAVVAEMHENRVDPTRCLDIHYLTEHPPLPNVVSSLFAELEAPASIPAEDHHRTGASRGRK